MRSMANLCRSTRFLDISYHEISGTRMIRKAQLLLALGLAACGTDVDSTQPHTYLFGPWEQAPGTEDIDLCVAATLHNDQPMYVNAVEMVAAPGLHHSNWMWVPDNGAFDFPEG